MRGLGNPFSVYSPTKIQGAEGEGRVMSPKNLKIGSLNVCGYNMLEGKRKVVGRIFVEEMFDVLVLSETKLKEEEECEFGCVSGKMVGVTSERTREGVA